MSDYETKLNQQIYFFDQVNQRVANLVDNFNSDISNFNTLMMVLDLTMNREISLDDKEIRKRFSKTYDVLSASCIKLKKIEAFIAQEEELSGINKVEIEYEEKYRLYYTKRIRFNDFKGKIKGLSEKFQTSADEFLSKTRGFAEGEENPFKDMIAFYEGNIAELKKEKQVSPNPIPQYFKTAQALFPHKKVIASQSENSSQNLVKKTRVFKTIQIHHIDGERAQIIDLNNGKVYLSDAGSMKAEYVIDPNLTFAADRVWRLEGDSVFSDKHKLIYFVAGINDKNGFMVTLTKENIDYIVVHDLRNNVITAHVNDNKLEEFPGGKHNNEHKQHAYLLRSNEFPSLIFMQSTSEAKTNDFRFRAFLKDGRCTNWSQNFTVMMPE